MEVRQWVTLRCLDTNLFTLKGGFRFCAWANCYISPIETIESTDAGNGNNTIKVVKVELLIGITCAIISFVL